MNLKQLAKVMTAGVLAMATVPAIALAHAHHPLRAASSLTATTTSKTRLRTSRVKHSSLISSKRHLHASKVKTKSLTSRRKSHTALAQRTHHTTKLSTKRKTHVL